MTESPRESSPETFSGSSPAGRLRVAVASDQSLIAEAVRAALAGRGLEVVALRWPDDLDTPRQRRTAELPPCEAGLMITELDRWSRVHASTLVLSRVPVPWVVLTTALRGPVWGAVLEAGARIVLPGRTGLEDVADILVGTARGEVAMDPTERQELEVAWTRLRDQRHQVSERLSHLTARESEVLQLLYVGQSVMSIAGLLEVAPATVRSQVKSVLRKLDVNSQLAAVAAFGDSLDPVRHPASG